MMERGLLSLFVAVIFLHVVACEATNTTCSPCGDGSECNVTTETDCLYGEITDQCGCCPVCAMGVGEICGGHPDSSTHARCADGLTCGRTLLSVLVYGSERAEGVCMQKRRPRSLTLDVLFNGVKDVAKQLNAFF